VNEIEKQSKLKNDQSQKDIMKLTLKKQEKGLKVAKQK